LRAELNFYRLFNETIEDFSVTRVAARQREAMAGAGLDTGGVRQFQAAIARSMGFS
jgi:hypothetical protein